MDDLDYVLSTIDPWLNAYLSNGPSTLQGLALIGVGVWTLEAEVNNGGFDQYYFNSAGCLAIPTVQSLTLIGANNTASLLAAANAEFPNSRPPVDRSERQNLLEQMGEHARFSTLETEFYQDKDLRIARLAQYLRAKSNE
jgi:hypothetical protein